MLKLIVSCLATLLAIALFFFSCFIAASDGQGAILFIFTFPAIFLLLGVAIVFTRADMAKVAGGFKRSAYWLSRATLAMTLAFLLSAFIPGLNFFSDGVMKAVIFSFESITGQTPYAWVRARNHLSVKIKDALKENGGQELDLREMSGSYRWDRVCFFGPYTSDEVASKVLQLPYPWQLSAHSKVGLSDGVNVLVFLYEDKTRGVSYVVELSRSLADFAKLSGQCFARQTAHFVKKESGSKEFQVK